MKNSMNQYFNEVNTITFLTKESEHQLAILAKNGDKVARERLISSHLKLVITLAKRYNGNNIDFEDLVQEGNLGLIAAVDNFDPAKNVRLSTYAKQWILEFIKRRVYNDIFAIHIPFKVAKTIHKSKDEQTQAVVNSLKNPICLNMKKNNTDDQQAIEYSDLIKDERELPEETVAKKELKSIMNKKINYILDERELEIIQERMLRGKKKTYKEIGKKMKLSLETIRLIEKKSIVKLKEELNDDLMDYL